MNIKGLSDPFPACDIEWRIQSSGFKNDKYWAMVLAYVDNRAIQDRLDEVCGPLGWQNEYKTGPQGGIICGISIWCDEKKQWVTKWDGSDNTQIEAVKGGLSASMKRSGSQWGVGRYLYNLEAMFAQTSTDNKRGQEGWSSAKESKTNKYFNWQTPQLPVWALPKIDLAAWYSGLGDTRPLPDNVWNNLTREQTDYFNIQAKAGD